jgi:tetratricopeptide (TPR) repeat protein
MATKKLKETKELKDRRMREATARKLCDDASQRAKMACDEAIKQANIVYEKAKTLAVNDQAKKEAAKAYEEAIKQAMEVRHTIEWEAQVVFTHTWVQSDKDYQEALTESKERIASAKKAYDEAKNQAGIVFEEAKKSADGKQVKEAVKAYKKAIEQAEKDYHEAIVKSQ